MQIKVLPHRQFGIEREGLAHVTDAVADRHVARIHLVSEELRLSFAGGQKARQHLHGGGFSAAIGAEKAKNLAARNLEADIVDGGEIAETHAKVGCLDGIITLTGRLSWRDMDFVVILALFFGKKRDEGGVEIGCRGAVEKFGGRAGGKNLAAIHGNQPVKTGGLLHISRCDDDAHARTPGTDRVDQFPELPPR